MFDISLLPPADGHQPGRARDTSAFANPGKDWWRQAVVYQIYPRSFADSNSDGLGDIPGITARLGHLRDLGVDAIWLSPFYPSPLADGGYDVADYRDVDPRLGTVSDFAELVVRAHAFGIRIIVDIVPNHTSSEHPWFQEALAAGPGSPARDRYIFRDGRGSDGSEPPSDWKSHFGGDAWTRLPDGQWYLHLFDSSQPDLNWDNPEVREDFLVTLRFWADLGVDGFRVDVAHGLVKDLSEPLRSQPNRDQFLPDDGSDPLYDRDEVHEIYAEWRRLFDSYDPPLMAVAESWAPLSRRPRYASSEGLGQAFNFDLVNARWDPRQFREIIQSSLELAALGGASSTWVLSNHDIVRHATRFALPNDTDLHAWLMSGGIEPPEDRELGLARARAATLMLLALPGSAYLYQGEELGLPEVADLAPADLHDPTWKRSGHLVKGRDGCRVPLPWLADQRGYGFSDSAPWLPQPEAFAALAADIQTVDPSSTLNLYRRALELRRTLQTDESLTWYDTPGAADFERPNGWRSITNFSRSPLPLPTGTVVLTSHGRTVGESIPADTTVWLHAR